MRSAPLLTMVAIAALLLAGCAQPTAEEPAASDFEDLNVAATATTGILIGIVVDEAIRPVEGVTIKVTKPDGGLLEDKTDDQGRFAFSGLVPGSYLVQAAHPQFTAAQSTAEVEAGVEDPPVVRILLERLFSQTPFSEVIKFDGYIACAYAVGVSSTCVNDYTRLVGSTVPGCQGGCLRDYNVSQAGGNTREYVSSITQGWQVVVMEAAWEPTSDLGKELGFTVSYFTRPDSGHWFGTVDGPSPLRIQFDVGDEHGSAQYSDGQPTIIPPEGTDELFIFFSAGSGGIAVNQGFASFQTRFYYGLPPEGWSLANGDPLPF